MSYLGVDQAAIKWFSSYLSGRTQRCNVSGKLSSARTLSCGVPQGSILGPLLFLIYINDLPNSLRGAVPRMFADDTNLTLSAKTLTELKLALTPELNNLSCWLKANKLSLNVAKTELMIIGSRQRLSAQCDDVEIRIDDQIIKRVDHTKSLGLTIDAQLSWGKHVEEICKKVSPATGALKRVRPFISKETAIQIYNALIMPHFDYCSPVWDCLSGYLSDKLQKLQNRAARVITKSPFDELKPPFLHPRLGEALSSTKETKSLEESHPPSLHCALTLNSRSSFAISRAPENPSFITFIFPPFFRQFIGVIKVLLLWNSFYSF